MLVSTVYASDINNLVFETNGFDKSTMFQDIEGTIPVTDNNQFVRRFNTSNEDVFFRTIQDEESEQSRFNKCLQIESSDSNLQQTALRASASNVINSIFTSGADRALSPVEVQAVHRYIQFFLQSYNLY